jgi:hypothetical protein
MRSDRRRWRQRHREPQHSSDAVHGAWGCLMYHEIPGPAEAVGYFAVEGERFAAHLDLLHGLGRNVQALERVLTATRNDVVALTFDDGHETHYRVAFPLLAERAMTATFFVTTSWVGTRGYVTWAQLREMVAAGMSVQSHTVTHPFLSESSRENARKELAVSKSEIEQNLGHPCSTVALPGGDWPRGWRPEEFAGLGYTCVATSRWGANRDGPSAERAGQGVAFVRRYTVRRDTPDALLRHQALALEPAFSREGVRLAALHWVRSALGPSRYAALRRRALRLLRRET